MTDMNYTRLGHSGLIVSRLALGTMTFTLGSDFIPGIANTGKDDAKRMVDMAIDAGVNFFDSADGYSGGDAEKILGAALNRKRQNVIICTKLGFRQSERITDAGLCRGHIMASVNGCLERLNTDWIDLLVVHKTDFTTPMEETLTALNDVVKQGKVRYLGCSNWPAWQVARAVQMQKDMGFSPFIAGQYLYNVVARDIEKDVLPMSKAMGLGLMAWSPLAGGLLTGKYDISDLQAEDGRLSEGDFLGTDPGQAEAAIKALSTSAEAHNASLAQVALAWILNQSQNHTVIVGANKIGQLETSLVSTGITLTADEIEKIGAAAAPVRRYPEWFDDMMTDETHMKALA